MLDRNAVLFITLQFGSRFANSFLVTAARYELLEAGGILQFAGAQVATSVARMVVSQVAGILTDNFDLKQMYVATEACNLVLAVSMLLCGHESGGVLFALNIGLGLLFAFSQPVTKSMPPAVTPCREDLNAINGWDLTCDKVGRYLAPFAYAVVSSSHGFRFAVLLSCFLYGLLALLRTYVKVLEPSQREQSRLRSTATVSGKLRGLLQQIVDGVMALRRDPVLRLLILNTLVTNVFLYPLNSVHFPVLFKRITEAGTPNDSVVDGLLQRAMSILDIKKKDMWRNYSALVSLGGVVGPFLSNVLIFLLESYSSSHASCRLWVGVNVGIAGQIATMALLALIVSMSSTLGSALLVFSLVGAWVVTISVNNVVTTYFNSISQERLQQNERGRFIANIMTVFTLGSSLGTLLFGWVLSVTSNDMTGSVNVLLCGLLVKAVLLVLLRRAGKGSFSSSGSAKSHAE